MEDLHYRLLDTPIPVEYTSEGLSYTVKGSAITVEMAGYTFEDFLRQAGKI